MNVAGPRFRNIVAAAFAVAAIPGVIHAAGVFRARDFSAKSAWNTKISPHAQYQPAPGVAGVSTGLDTWEPGDAYTVPCYIATTADPLRPLLYNRDAWYNVARGKWKRFGNSVKIEARILAGSSANFPPPGNPYSSISAKSWVLPKFMRGLPAPPPQFFNYASSMLPPSGTDGHMAVGQPSGLVVETYATIMLSSGDVVALSYAVTNPASLGNARQNGQTASMLPVYGGLIEDIEMTKGVNHAMAISVPASLLTTSIAAPAATFDRDALTTKPPYSGALPMGARLGLPPDFNLATLGLITPEGWAIARAAAAYGFIMAERGGSGITVHVRPNAPDQDPLLHAWNAPLQADLNAIFAKLVYFPD